MAKTVKVTVSNPQGVAISTIFNTILELDGKPVQLGKYGTKYVLEQEVNFIVCDLRACHGNTSVGGAWLYDPSTQLNIEVFL